MTVSAFGVEHNQIRKDDEQARHLTAGALLAGAGGVGLHHASRSLHATRGKAGLATIGAMLAGKPTETRRGLKALALSHKGAQLAHSGSKAAYLGAGVLGAAALGSTLGSASRRRRAAVAVEPPQGEKVLAKSAFGVVHKAGNLEQMHLVGGLWRPAAQAHGAGKLWTPGGHAAAKPGTAAKITGKVKGVSSGPVGHAIGRAGKKILSEAAPQSHRHAVATARFAAAHKGAIAAAGAAAAAGGGLAHVANRGARAGAAAAATRRATNLGRLKRVAIGTGLAGAGVAGAADLAGTRARKAKDKQEAEASKPPPRYGSPR